MKYKPEPITEEEHIPEHEYLEDPTTGEMGIIEEQTKRIITGWKVDLEEDNGGYIFENQDEAMEFCLLLEIKDLLKTKEIRDENWKDVPEMRTMVAIETPEDKPEDRVIYMKVIL